MPTTTRLITADEFWALPADHQRRELIRGQLCVMAPTGFEHGGVVVNLTRLLANHVVSQKLGRLVGAKTGFVLSRDPDTVRAPDVAFVRSVRVEAAGRTVKFWDGAPDLAVEVLSPSDTAEEVEDKVDEYLSAGTALVWLVNPRRRTVTAYRAKPAAISTARRRQPRRRRRDPRLQLHRR